MITSISPMIEQFFDTMIAASVIKCGYSNLSKDRSLQNDKERSEEVLQWVCHPFRSLMPGNVRFDTGGRQHANGLLVYRVFASTQYKLRKLNVFKLAIQQR